MVSIDKPDNQLITVKWRLPAVHPEGRKFTVIAAFVTLIAFLLLPNAFGWLLAGLSLGVAAFFRDPVRTTPQDPALILAPADGLVTMISRVAPPLELAGEGGLSGELVRVSIFMSVFDVHFIRTPIAGRIALIAYVPGKFLNADFDKASEDNERQHILVERDDGVKVGFTQIAGLVARRIMAFVAVGDQVAAGERVGLIRFGSRVDVFLPAGTGANVLLGQRTVAGETVLGIIGQDVQRRGISQ
jgi:phosphatidylserine decarboxylase